MTTELPEKLFRMEGWYPHNEHWLFLIRELLSGQPNEDWSNHEVLITSVLVNCRYTGVVRRN